jgi:DNA-binding transcriptional MerR regulator
MPDGLDHLAIGEVARLSGVPASAIRYYERLGLLHRPPRSGGRRQYEPDVLDQLTLVLLAREAGFSLREVRELVGALDTGREPARSWKQLATRKLEELGVLAGRVNRMRRVLRHALDCDCPTLEKCAPLLRPLRARRGQARGLKPK